MNFFAKKVLNNFAFNNFFNIFALNLEIFNKYMFNFNNFIYGK